MQYAVSKDNSSKCYMHCAVAERHILFCLRTSAYVCGEFKNIGVLKRIWRENIFHESPGWQTLNAHTAIISVGSNLGDKAANCRQGIDALLNSGKASLVKMSRFYRTSPVDYLDQDWFVNAAVQIKTHLEPLDLLAFLQTIQQQAGRPKGGIRFGPRVLDLDMIFYDQLVMKTTELEIPHPRMHKRHFVLQPICDIDPDIIHPLLNMPLKSLLNQLEDSEQEVFEL